MATPATGCQSQGGSAYRTGQVDRSCHMLAAGLLEARRASHSARRAGCRRGTFRDCTLDVQWGAFLLAGGVPTGSNAHGYSRALARQKHAGRTTRHGNLSIYMYLSIYLSIGCISPCRPPRFPPREGGPGRQGKAISQGGARPGGSARAWLARGLRPGGAPLHPLLARSGPAAAVAGVRHLRAREGEGDALCLPKGIGRLPLQPPTPPNQPTNPPPPSPSLHPSLRRTGWPVCRTAGWSHLPPRPRQDDDDDDEGAPGRCTRPVLGPLGSGGGARLIDERAGSTGERFLIVGGAEVSLPPPAGLHDVLPVRGVWGRGGRLVGERDCTIGSLPGRTICDRPSTCPLALFLPEGTPLPQQEHEDSVGELVGEGNTMAAPEPGTPTSPAAAPEFALPASLAPMKDRLQVDTYAKAIQKKAGGKGFFRSRSSSKSADVSGFTVEDLLPRHRRAHSPVLAGQVVGCSLLKLSSDHSSRATKIYQNSMKYMGEETGAFPAQAEEDAIIAKLLKDTLKRPELRDEVFLQMVKLTRGNSDTTSALRAWELFLLVAASMPPSKDLAPFLSEYIHDCASSNHIQEVQRSAGLVLAALKRSMKSGPRRTVPTPEEVGAMKAGRMLTTIAFFLDDTFEELSYDMTTTVREAVEFLAGIIKLKDFQTFSLFEARKTITQGRSADPTEESFPYDENRYIGDILQEFRAIQAKTVKGEVVQSKLLFKKRLFRETDEQITDPIFVTLSYVQAQHDYLAGAYPVGRDDAAQLAALQILVDNAHQADEENGALPIENYVPKMVLPTRPRAEWDEDVSKRCKTLEHYGKDDLRGLMLKIMWTLPYGNSVFYAVKRIEDPIGLLPGKLILGINKRGVHFFRPVPKEYLHTAELRDIMQFGSSNSAVFFKMRVAGQLHIFQFETKQGEEICIALQTHINDVMMKRYSKGKSMSTAATEAGKKVPQAQPNQSRTLATAQAQEMNKVLEDANKRIDALAEEKRAVEAQKAELEVLYQDSVAKLEQDQITKKEMQEAQDMMTKRLETAESRVSALQVELAKATSDVSSAESALSAAKTKSAAAKTAKPAADSVKVKKLEDQLKEAQNESKSAVEKLRSAESIAKQLRKEKDLAEAKILRMEKAHTNSTKSAEDAFSKERDQIKSKLLARDKKVNELTAQIAEMTQQIKLQEDEFQQMQKDTAELEELREMKADVQRKEKQNAQIITRQGEQIAELEALYKEEQVLRKRYFNMMEDMKGKIRVFCRARPFSQREAAEGAKQVITSPDEFTMEHPTKDDKKKQYNFDRFFDGTCSQEQVFEDTKYLVQSAVDGYNVCIFAYGQTGSGKTYTIHGDSRSPGLQPRAMEELFSILERDANKFSFEVEVYMLELYQDQLMDLLSPDNSAKLEIKKDQKGLVTVQGAVTQPVSDYRAFARIVNDGMKNRHVAATKMNADSSRSHLVLSVIVKSVNLQTQNHVVGKLSFVDLAGSERNKKSGSTGEQLKEAQSINKSLSALGDVISALASEQQFIPYRNHKLTMLMSDSLGGNAKTLMFVNISPASVNLDETQNSLTYAQRVRTITNDAQKNVSSKKIAALEKKLAFWREKAGGGPGGLEDIEV
eukprot:scaffold668_cov385-Prasinococcus_capsulatus_cf.AAC.17